MERMSIPPRIGWEKKVEALGFGYHSLDMPYWDESACYSFSMDEINAIEKASNELWTMCIAAVGHVIDNDLFHLFHVPAAFIPFIKDSWENDAPSIYARFDLGYKDGQIKLYECNADTPTSLYEAAVIQWYWLHDVFPNKDQFNSIHEKLISYWAILKPHLKKGITHFASVKDSLEDYTTTEYMRDCALQGGIDTKQLYIQDIGWQQETQLFTDTDDMDIKNIFKLYPWEWLMHEEFGKNILIEKNKIKWIEPAWRMLLSNKAILAILWQLYPDNPYLLPTYFDTNSLSSYAKKPLLSREGANIELVQNANTIATTNGEYGEEGYVYQELFTLPTNDGKSAVIGSWIVGQESVGIGIRESDQLVTTNTSRFVPHIIL